jgi:hypothetical protein
MADEYFCTLCKRELKGVLEIRWSDIDIHTYLVTAESLECNWRQCRGCKTIICKRCDDAQRNYCCEEGRKAAHERAALKASMPRRGTFSI